MHQRREADAGGDGSRSVSKVCPEGVQARPHPRRLVCWSCTRSRRERELGRGPADFADSRGQEAFDLLKMKYKDEIDILDAVKNYENMFLESGKK